MTEVKRDLLENTREHNRLLLEQTLLIFLVPSYQSATITEEQRYGDVYALYNSVRYLSVCKYWKRFPMNFSQLRKCQNLRGSIAKYDVAPF